MKQHSLITTLFAAALCLCVEHAAGTQQGPLKRFRTAEQSPPELDDVEITFGSHTHPPNPTTQWPTSGSTTRTTSRPTRRPTTTPIITPPSKQPTTGQPTDSPSIAPQPTPRPSTMLPTPPSAVSDIASFDSGTTGGTSWSGSIVGAQYQGNNPTGNPIILKLVTSSTSDWFIWLHGTRVTITRTREDQSSQNMGELVAGQSETISNWRGSNLDLVIEVHEVNDGSPSYADLDIVLTAMPSSSEPPTTSRPTLSPSVKPTAEPARSPSKKPIDVSDTTLC